MRLPPKGPRSLSLSSHDMEDVPAFGVATRCDAVGLLFLEHLDVKTVQRCERRVALEKGDARPAEPAIARAVPLAAEPPARGQRLANAREERVEFLRFAQRHGEA